MASAKMTDSSTTAVGRPRRQQPALVKHYLALYNLVQFLGWGYGLILTLQFLVSARRLHFAELWQRCSLVIQIFQTLQLMEVVHAAVRFVPSNPFQTFTQIFSRLMVVWGILYPLPEARHSVGVPLLLLAWCLAEITRYIYYALNIYDAVPYICTWLRYTLFIVLYPMGVTGELFTMYAALEPIRQRKLWSLELPNHLNMSFYYFFFVIAIMLSYIHFFPQLYFYMFRQRGKILGGKSVAKSD